MSMYTDLIDNLEILKLDNIKNMLPGYLDEMKDKNISFTEMLYDLTKEEIKYQTERAAKVNIKVSAFPFEKTLDNFDFSYQPSVDKTELYDLETLRFMEKSENIIFVGTSGVGKTHLAVGIGMAAAKRRISTYYITFNDLINQLVQANSENRADIKIKYFCKYKLLIIDEIGYLPITKEGAYLFFQLINKRYEKKSTILTTNQVFSKRSDIFGDSVVTAAIIDRLVHHSHIIKIKGQSYRIKDRNVEMQRNIEKEGV